MSYLEELLPEFRKGAKIRKSDWGKEEYIYVDKLGGVRNEKGEEVTLPFFCSIEDCWEFYTEPEPDWDYIIKNKCLCRFWDDEENPIIGVLIGKRETNNNEEYRHHRGSYFNYCRPICRDEVTFYEDREE